MFQAYLPGISFMAMKKAQMAGCALRKGPIKTRRWDLHSMDLQTYQPSHNTVVVAGQGLLAEDSHYINQYTKSVLVSMSRSQMSGRRLFKLAVNGIVFSHKTHSRCHDSSKKLFKK
ncbi:hypothetical protein AHF37_12420 [Paragonimus kellicotti]|nr:hypothetical protein AHF37_12420 [Paragonimus kellicotti]